MVVIFLLLLLLKRRTLSVSVCLSTYLSIYLSTYASITATCSTLQCKWEHLKSFINFFLINIFSFSDLFFSIQLLQRCQNETQATRLVHTNSTRSVDFVTIKQLKTFQFALIFCAIFITAFSQFCVYHVNAATTRGGPSLPLWFQQWFKGKLKVAQLVPFPSGHRNENQHGANHRVGCECSPPKVH